MHASHDQPRERLFYFRRRFHPTQRMLRGVFVPAPWLDVVLLVVLFFITQSSFVVQPGVSLELPVSPASGHERYGDPDDRVLYGYPQVQSRCFAEKDLPHGYRYGFPFDDPDGVVLKSLRS